MESLEPQSAREIVLRASDEGETGEDVADEIERSSAGADAEIEKRLQKAAEDIREIVKGKRVATFGGNQAGEALQGVQGSSKIGVEKTVKADGTVDAVQLADIVAHEQEHEEQAKQWDAEEVTLRSGDTLTRTEISETAAMDEQETLAHVSEEYRAMYRKVTSFVSADRAREIARSGDLLSLAV